MIRWIETLSTRNRFIFLFLTALCFRLIYFLLVLSRNNPEGFLIYDSYGYIQIASNLVDNHTFSQSFISPLEPDYFRTPVYPLFLSLFKIAGTHVWLTILIQLFISSSTVLVIYKITESLELPVRTGILASLLYCIEPASICFSTFILTETLFVFLFTIAIYYLILFVRYRIPKHFYIFSFLFAIAILTRPAPVYLAFVIFPFMMMIRFTMIRKILLGVLIFILTLSPWFIRNTITFGKPFLTRLDDEMLLFYHASSIVSEKEQISLQEAQNKLWTAAIHEFDGDPKNEVTRFTTHVRDKAFGVIHENTGIYVKQHLYGVISIAFKPVRGYFDSQLAIVKGYQSITPGEFPANQKMRTAFFKVASGFSSTMVIIQLAILLFCYLFFFHGIQKIRFDNHYVALIFLFIIFYFLNMVVPPFSEGRLRLPLMPIILIIGSTGFYNFLQMKKLKKNKA